MSLFFLSLLFYLLLISEQGFLIFCLRPTLFLFTVSLSFSVLPFMLFPVISALIPFFFFTTLYLILSFISLSSLFLLYFVPFLDGMTGCALELSQPRSPLKTLSLSLFNPWKQRGPSLTGTTCQVSECNLKG